MSKPKLVHKRVWLDPKEPDVMSWCAYTEQDYGDPGDVEIQIADCTRVITLQLNNAKAEAKIERLVKLLNEALDLRAFRIENANKEFTT